MRMGLRLLLGIIKGLFIGGLLGFALAKVGMAAPGAFIAYLAAALGGVLIGLIAGKPIWAKDAKIEAGMKAVVGALLGVGLMFVARRWLTFEIPLSLGDLSAANTSLGETTQNGTFGGLAITSLAAITALLGGFYDADNTPSDDESQKDAAKDDKKEKSSVRIAAAADEEDEVEVEAEQEKKRSRR